MDPSQRCWWPGLTKQQQEGRKEARLERYLRRQVLKMNGHGDTKGGREEIPSSRP